VITLQKYVYTPSRFMLPDSHYDEKRADHAVAFIEQLKHVKTNEWAGVSFKLLPWQETVIRDLFGIINKSGYRQFRHAFVEVPKKSGKSELAAAVALYLLCADGEIGAEIYSVANDRDQAGIVFNIAKMMAQDNKTLRKYCKFVEYQKRIIFLPTRSFYAAISSEVRNKYGIHVHGCIFDELLGQTERTLFDKMTLASGAGRRQPLNFIITTAGNDRNSICYNQHTYSLDILQGRKFDPTFYPVVFSANDDDDWEDPAVWKRVNPSYGTTVNEEFFVDFHRRAKYDVDVEHEFRQFMLNQWLSAERKWLPMDRYDVGNTPFNPAELKGRKCYGGLDLASTDDIAAFVLVFPPDDEHGEYFVLPFFWIPAGNMERRVKKDHVPYDKWKRAGFLETTDGNIIHYDFIEKKIKELSELYDIQQVGFDRWSAIQMAQNLDAENIEMVAIGQGYSSMSPPSKELMRIVLDGKLRHGGNPALRWMFENVFIETDAAGNIKPSKKKSSEKIDGAVATIMALNLAVRHEESGSVYDHRGLLVLGED
jgi:phage terminase large subunit-like protein